MTATRVCGLWLAMVFSLAAQTTNPIEYLAQYSATLSGAQGSIAIAIPLNHDKNLVLKSANIRCSVECTLTHIREATITGGSPITAVKRNPNAAWVPATTAAITGGATISGGTTIVSGQVISANTLTGLNLSGSTTTAGTSNVGSVLERGAAGARNYVIQTASMTGTVWILLLYEERNQL